MNRGNRGLNDRAIGLLDVKPGSRVLDLGFGGGVTFPALLERGAAVVGVDRARDMVDAAKVKHRADVEAGRLTVLVGEVETLPLQDAALDRVLTINTVYFWQDLAAGLRELHRVLAPGGMLVIGIRDGSVMKQVSPDVFTLRSPGALAAALEAAGFEEVVVKTAADGATHLLRATRR
jgi:arsenite methyltransferase